MTPLLLATGSLLAACAGSPSEPAAPSAPPPDAPASSSDALWERCRSTIERRCTAADPSGGDAEQRCRKKLHARYLRIKTEAARREYVLALGCRPATVD